jgi:hypothetical protein
VPNGENGTSANITYRAWDQTSGTEGTKLDTTTNGATSAFSTATDTAAITVIAVNDAPTFAGLSGTASFTEGGSPMVLDGDVTVADVEVDAANDFAGASLYVARNGGANANDSFGFDTSTSGFTVSGGNLQSGGSTFGTFTNTGGTLSVSFTSSGTAATGALVDDVLQHVTYENTGDDPGASAQLDWTFDDGGGQGTGGALTDTDTVTVSITSVNDAPTASTTADHPTFTEGGAAATPFSGAAVDTIEAGQTITGFTFTVQNLADGSDEVAVVDGSDITLTNTTSGTTTGNSLNYSVSVAGSTATVTLSNGSLSAADAETVINGIAYRNDSEAPSTGSTRDFALTEIIDSGGTPNGGDDTGTPIGGASSVTVAAVNTAPVLGGINGETSQIVAGAGAQNVDLLDDATASDVDSTDFATGSLSIAQGPGTANGSWGLDGTNATSGGDGTIATGETLAVGGTGIGTVDSTDDGQGGNSLTIALNANATPALVQTLLQNFTYSAPTGLGDRGFTLTLDDGDGGAATDTAGFTVDVTPNPPTIGNLDTDALSYTESDGAQVLDQGTAAAVTDPDSTNFDGGNVTVSITGGGDAAEDSLSIRNEGTGAGEIGFDGTNVTFGGTQIGTAAGGTSGADLVVTLDGDATPTATGALLQNLTYENTDTDDPTGGTRTISVSVADSGTSPASDTVTLTVDVTPLNDPPVAQDDAFTTGENTQIAGEDVLADNGNGADGDPDDTLSVGQVAGSAGNVGIATGGSNGGQFTITATGALAFDPGTDFDSLAQGDTDTTTVTYTVSDGSLTDTATVAVTVNGANDAPSGTDGSVSVQPGQTLVLQKADFGFSDPDIGDTLDQVTIDTVPGDGTLFVDGSGAGTDDGTLDGETALTDGAVVTETDIANGNLLYEAPATSGTPALSFMVNDGDTDAAAPNTLTIDVNTPPSAPAPTSLSIDENTTAVGTLSASDPDVGDTVTLSLTGGADQSDFSFDPATGALTFATAPDSEAPADADGDNVYEVEVSADDGTTTTSAVVSVTVTDVSEGGGGGGGTGDGNEDDGEDGDGDTTDGATVNRSTNAGPDGAPQEVTEIDRVPETREDDPETPNADLADVPIGNQSDGENDLSMGLPAGVDATVEGKTSRLSGQAAADDLIARIEQQAGDQDREELAGDGQSFLDGLPSDRPITVRTITPSFTGDGVPGTIQLGGSDSSDSFEAVVLDASNLPSGTVIDLSDVDFVSIVGGSTIRGGSGEQTATGDSSSQIIVLGPGDDVLRGGGGDDEVRSEGGDDRLYGGTGDDIVRGGADDDRVDGGPGADRLFGDPGDDTLVAGDGDTLVGGIGNDRVELTGFTGRLTWIDPTPNDTLVLSNLNLTPAQVRVDSQDLSANQAAVLRLDVDGDGSFAEDEPAIMLDRLARAEVAVTAAEGGGTAITLAGPDLPLTDLTAEDQLASLYVAYFGRGADPQGLAFWEDRFDSALAEGDSALQALTAIAEDFRFSEEAFERFPVLDPATPTDSQGVQGFVESVYDSLFNRTPEEAGLDFWTGQFQERIESRQDIGTLLITIMAAASDADTPGETNDATTVRNKIEAAGALTDALDESGLALGADIGLDQVRALLADTDAAYSSFETALEEIQALTTTGSDDVTA